MQWRCAIGLGWFVVAPNLGCSDTVPSRGIVAPRAAKAERRETPRRVVTNADCCASGRQAEMRGEASSERIHCDELEELEQQFSNVKPIRVQSGKATYYSDALSGRTMASGEIYRPDCAQAAHRTLPFGTVARVRMTKTGATVVVRITDRGPFAGRGRIIDLSHGAARKIGLLRAGVADVRVEVLQVPKGR